MAHDYFMRQCTVFKSMSDRTIIQIAWIPEAKAIEGKYIKLKIDDQWVDGWVVRKVGSTRMTARMVGERSQDYKHQREASDI